LGEEETGKGRQAKVAAEFVRPIGIFFFFKSDGKGGLIWSSHF
jgi:hypothetical protein